MTSNLGVWEMAVPKVITQLSCLEIFKGKRPTEGAGDDKDKNCHVFPTASRHVGTWLLYSFSRATNNKVP